MNLPKRILHLALPVLLWGGSIVQAASFSDVPSGSPYQTYIKHLQTLGITDGVSPGRFGPDQTLTRAQFAKFISVAFQLSDNGTSSPFADVAGHWSEPYINAAYQAAIIDGTTDSAFSPDEPVKRQEAATMVWRLAEQKGLKTGGAPTFSDQPAEWAVEAVGGVIVHGWFGPEASFTSHGWTYRPQDLMTRQEMAALLDLSMKELPGSLTKPVAVPTTNTGSSPGTSTGTNGALPADAAITEPWQQLLQAHMQNRDTSFQITNVDRSAFDQVKAVTDKILAADDYLHYTYDGMSYQFDGLSTITFKVSYLETKEQSDYVAEQAKSIVSSIIDADMNDVAKEKAIHDYIVTHVKYDRSLQDHTAYGALTKGTTVCQGYALLTYRMLLDAGIPNRIVEGYADGELHTWNVAQIDGGWYHLDSTWDDPVPDVEGRVRYDYFNLTDAQIRQDHKFTGSYPSAVTDFVQTFAADQTLLASLGLSGQSAAFTANSKTDVAAIVQRELAAGATQISFRYKSTLGTAKSVVTAAMTNAVMLQYNVSGIQYSYSSDTRSPGYTSVKIDVTYD